MKRVRRKCMCSRFHLPRRSIRSSTGGGHFPVWSSNGRQLFYATNDIGGGSQITSVDIQTQPSFTFGKPIPLPIEGILGALTIARGGTMLTRSVEASHDVLCGG